MKKITKKEFENSLTNFKKIELSLDKKERMKSKIMLSSRMQNAQDIVEERTLKSPYFSAFHFSYRMFITAFALVLLISVSTTEASKNSIPGDILYPIKTTIREPLIKFTKINQKERADFDLVLADTRIQELEELIAKNKTSEEYIGENSALFEKHIADSKKDRAREIKSKKDIEEEKDNKEGTAKNKKEDSSIEVATTLKVEIDETKEEEDVSDDTSEEEKELEDQDTNKIELEIEKELREIEEDFKLNSRVEKYNDLMISIYDTNLR